MKILILTTALLAATNAQAWCSYDDTDCKERERQTEQLQHEQDMREAQRAAEQERWEQERREARARELETDYGRHPDSPTCRMYPDRCKN